jgi:beta-glucanase (GH16 family)
MTRPILAAVLLAALAAASVRPFATAPASTPRPHAPLPPGYELVFAEEFDGPVLDETIWEYREGRRTGASFIDGYNRRENVRIADGSLEIVARREPVNGQMENTGGGVLSRIDFGYGYYETRAQPFLGGRGVHSAFWQTGSVQPNNQVFEIDSFEITSPSRVATNNLYMALQSPAERTPWPHRAHLPYAIPVDGWIIDAFERTPDGVVYYDNGTVVARAEWPDLPEQQRIWLTALNGMGAVDPAALPGTTRFDYFRYYARDHPGVNLLGNGSLEYNQRPASDPIAWTITGAASAVAVVPGDAKHGRYRLRCG